MADVTNYQIAREAAEEIARKYQKTDCSLHDFHNIMEGATTTIFAAIHESNVKQNALVDELAEFIELSSNDLQRSARAFLYKRDLETKGNLLTRLPDES